MADSDNEATHKVKVADELVKRAKQTRARLTFIEDAALLNDIGGIGATALHDLSGGYRIMNQ
jgi:hypothetical protein